MPRNKPKKFPPENADGSSFDKIEHPYYYGGEAAPTPDVERLKQKTRPAPKVFGSALLAAEKRLSEAINERAVAMQQIAMLNVETPALRRSSRLVEVIKARGGALDLPQGANPVNKNMFLEDPNLGGGGWI